MACGFASVFQSLTTGNLRLAAWLILLAALLDKLDGSVARLLKGSTEFGVQFDSFADNVAFGIAPAALVYSAASAQTPAFWGAQAELVGLPAMTVLSAICIVYAVMTTVRLARFNVTTASNGPYLFIGLPSTLSGGLLASGYLAVYEAHVLETFPHIFALFPLFLAINSILMVCNLPLPKFKVSKKPLVRAVQLGLGACVYATIFARVGFTFVLVLLAGYLLLGFAWLGPRLLSQQQTTAQK